ncbi:MAG: PilW family protein [Bacteriovoracia bacterium]
MKSEQGMSLLSAMVAMSVGLISLYALQTGMLNTTRASHRLASLTNAQEQKNYAHAILSNRKLCSEIVQEYGWIYKHPGGSTDPDKYVFARYCLPGESGCVEKPPQGSTAQSAFRRELGLNSSLRKARLSALQFRPGTASLEPLLTAKLEMTVHHSIGGDSVYDFPVALKPVVYHLADVTNPAAGPGGGGHGPVIAPKNEPVSYLIDSCVGSGETESQTAQKFCEDEGGTWVAEVTDANGNPVNGTDGSPQKSMCLRSRIALAPSAADYFGQAGNDAFSLYASNRIIAGQSVSAGGSLSSGQSLFVGGYFRVQDKNISGQTRKVVEIGTADTSRLIIDADAPQPTARLKWSNPASYAGCGSGKAIQRISDAGFSCVDVGTSGGGSGSVTAMCPAGQVLQGINNGNPVCVANGSGGGAPATANVTVASVTSTAGHNFGTTPLSVDCASDRVRVGCGHQCGAGEDDTNVWPSGTRGCTMQEAANDGDGNGHGTCTVYAICMKLE